jgi:acetylserotonin O-methyltransferase
MIDPNPVIDLIYAFRRSKAMFAAVEIGVFDRLAQSPADASAFSGDPDAMERLLNACVAMGLLEKEEGRYRNSAAANEYLRSDSPSTLAGYIQYSNFALYPMWGHLEQALETGVNRWEQTFGFTANQLFDHYFRTDTAKRAFITGMHGFGQLSSPAVAAAFDLSHHHRFIDLGGATGHLALAVLERYPNLHAAVFDLPAVIEVTREFSGGRFELIPGDFFRDPLPKADVFALGRILHDWSEPKIRQLLAKIYRALPRGGALLIAEKLLHEDKTGPVDALLQSLNMLVCTEGKERTLSEYSSLLKEAGFASVEGRSTGCPVDAILAVKH